jgi:hypothetical protein
MHRELFDKYKDTVVAKVNKRLTDLGVGKREREDLNRVLSILDKYYQFANWQLHQGLLAHTLIDSLEIDHELSGELISFDRYLY